MDTTCKEHSLCRVMRGVVAFALLASAGLGSAFVFFRSFPGLAVAPPNLIPYQGRVLNANGVPVAVASADMQFRLYDSLAAGTCLWSNASATCASNADLAVTLTDGLFSENLGDTGAGYAAISDSVFADDASVYLEVQVEGETLSPRKRIGAAAYAMNAQSLDGLDSTDYCLLSGGADCEIENSGITFPGIGVTPGALKVAADVGGFLSDTLTLDGGTNGGVQVAAGQSFWTNGQVVNFLDAGDQIAYIQTRDLGTEDVFQLWVYPDTDGWIIFGPSPTDSANFASVSDSGDPTVGTIHFGSYLPRSDASTIPIACASTDIDETAPGTPEACFMADGSLDLGLALAGTNMTIAQGGIDRTSGAAETFAFTNGGAGTLGITIDGTADVAGHMAVGADAIVDDGSLLYPGSTYSNVLNVSETSTEAGVDYVEGITNYLLYNPSADASAASVYGLDNELWTDSGNTEAIYSLNGTYSDVRHQGSGTVTSAIGTYSNAETYAGVVDDIFGGLFYGTNGTDSVGILGEGYKDTTFMTAGRTWGGYFAGFAFNDVSAGTDSTYGVYSRVSRTGATGGTINTYGMYVQNDGVDAAGAGTANFYGLYLESITGADTNYALYSAGGQSYHAGNFGIGATSPDAHLDIESTEDTERVRLTDSSNADSVGLYVGDGTAGLDGTLSAQAGSLFLDEDGKLWVNMDGATNWDQVATTAGGALDLDGTYDNDSDKKMAVDNASGLEFESTVAGDVIVDLQSSGDFEIQSVGTTFATFNDSGNVAFENTVTLGSSSADAVLFNADVDTSILPDDDDTYDLGADAQRWRDLYLGPATLHIGSLVGDEGTLSYDTTANALVVNESGTDTDFRLEGDTDTDLLFVDASADQVGIGGTPLGKLSVDGDADEAQLLVQAHSTQASNLVVIENSSANDLVVVDGTGNMGIGDSTPNALLDLDTGSPAGRTIGTLASGTQSGDLTALELDFDSLMAGAADADFTGVNLLTPNLTQSTAVTTSYLGYNLTAGAITQDTLAGTINWTGARIAMPVQQELAGTMTTSGLTITDNGSSNSGTKRGLFVDFGGIQSGGTVVGLDIDSITTGGGNGLGLRVGSGFDTDLVFVDSTAVVRTPNAGTLDFQDGSENSLMLLTDAGSTGNLEISGTFGVDDAVTLGDAGADTVTSNAAAWTFANDTAVTLSGGVDGLSFDGAVSNTLSIDTTNGRVGIDTAAPSTQLHVYNDTGGVNYATAFHVGTGTYGAFVGDSMDTEVSPTFMGRPNGTGASTYLLSRIDTAEDSGTTPAMIIQGQTSVGPAVITTRPLLSINNYTTQLLTVDAGGSLGIGDSTPDYLLDVAGTFGVDGNMVLGDAVTDNLTVTAALQGASALAFDGATDDTNETAFSFTDPTADRTITFQNASGTVAFTSDIPAAGANASLSNLSGVAINTSLLPASSPTAGASSQATTAVDSTDSVGEYGSVAIGTDGFPVISYFDATNLDLKVTKCGNAACSSGNTVSTAASTGDVGVYTSVAIGTDGFPVISHYDFTNGDLMVTKCGNAACSSGNTTTAVDSTNDVGQYTSIAIGTDGLPVISYQDFTNGDLRVTKCGNAACSSGNTTTSIDTTNNVGRYTAIAIGTDGLPVISHRDQTNGDLRVTKCGNAACSSGNATTAVDTTDDVGAHSSIAIGTDGLPVISYNDATNADLKAVKCGNAACSSGNTVTSVDSTNDVGRYTSIAIGTDGLPAISHHDETNGNLRVTKCGNAACSSGNVTTAVDTTNDVGEFSAIAIGTDGLPVISHSDLTNGDLRVAKCADPGCTNAAGGSFASGTDIGSLGKYFGNVYAASFWGKQFAIEGFDLAETYRVRDASVEAGDIVAIDPDQSGGGGPYMALATDAAKAVGIVSTKPGIALSEWKGDEHTRPVALAGRVPTKVNDQNGAIAVGDPVTLSSVPGVGMKAVEAGQIVGYALEPFAGPGQGSVVVFVKAGHYSGSGSAPLAGTDNQASELGVDDAGVTEIGSRPADGLSALNMSGNIYMQGNSILDVGAIAGLGGIWSVDAEGTFRTEGSYRAVITSYQDEKVEAVAPLSLEHKVTLDGTATLENGTATVSFEAVSPSFNDITSTTADIRVSVTPNGPAYLYVVSKDHNGFTVQQLNGTDSGITFDWFVSAYRKDYEPAVGSWQEAVGEEPPVVEEPPAEPPVVDEPPAEEPPVEEPSVIEEPLVTEPTPAEEPAATEPTDSPLPTTDSQSPA